MATIIEEIANNQIVKVILIQSKTIEVSEKKVNNGTLKFMEEFFVSKKELSTYLQKSGDKNSVHIGEKPIIPGILILQKLTKKFGKNMAIFSIKFINPAYLEQRIQLFQSTENEIVGTINGLTIFQFSNKILN